MRRYQVDESIPIDRILVSILQKRLKSITEEMSIAMARTTRSPILCEAQDFVTGLYDYKGDMLEQKENLPILAFSLQPVCKYIIDYFGDDIHDGDVIFHNDVFSMGNQNNDVAAYKPIFWEGELVAWAAVKGHQADVGGNVRGSYNPRATEVWQETLRITPVKVYEKGKLRKDVWDLIFANVRLDIVAEDMRAEIGSCVVGERGIHKILERYGRPVFEAHKEFLFDSTEQMMRSELRSIPDGTYVGESYAYYDGVTPGSKYKIKVTITVTDGHITFDYTGTDGQTPGFVNGTYSSSASAAILTLLQMINPDIPHNGGLIRPIDIIIPEGTILNAAYPAATTYGNHLCPNNADAIMRALSPVIPERVTAEWNEALISMSTGQDPRNNGEPFVDIFFMGQKGGSGGIYGTDGYDHIGMIDASGGVLDQDYEIFEQATPPPGAQARVPRGLCRPRPLAGRHGHGDHLPVRWRGRQDHYLRRWRCGAVTRLSRRRRWCAKYHQDPHAWRDGVAGACHQRHRGQRTRGHRVLPDLRRRRRLGQSQGAACREGAARCAQRTGLVGISPS